MSKKKSKCKKALDMVAPLSKLADDRLIEIRELQAALTIAAAVLKLDRNFATLTIPQILDNLRSDAKVAVAGGDGLNIPDLSIPPKAS
jgi:hypothetical protein